MYSTVAVVVQTWFYGSRLILMRSDSELQIFTFRSEKRIGLLMQSDIGKSDGIKSDLNPMAQVVTFPKSDTSANRILASVFDQYKSS